MKIVIAPNAFKGSLTAPEVAASIRRGVLRVFPDAETVELPIADGGDGTLELIVGAAGGTYAEATVHDPLGREITARYGLLPDGETGVIEMAAASGLRLLKPDELNPMTATTYGTGQLINAAVARGCRRLIIGVGGSATVDGGAGMLQALGAGLYTADDTPIAPGGDGLMTLEHIDLTTLDPRLRDVEITVACDVENPLTGAEGAAAVFAPQKGASPAQVAQLEHALTQYGGLLGAVTGVDVLNQPAMGAAGGITAALVACLDARIESGAGVVLQAMNIAAHLEGAHLLITGEGRIDAQTAYGKGPMAVAHIAQAHGLPVMALAGSLGVDVLPGIDALMAITDAPMPLETAMEDAARLIETATARALYLLRVGMMI